MRSVLVVGGAGYIGSHMLLALRARSTRVVVLDNLSTGHADAVGNSELIVGNLANADLLDSIFRTYRFDAVMHFAALSQVQASVEDPAAYYENNVAATTTLLRAMLRHRIERFVFSSTAAVYGVPDVQLIDEDTPTVPINPYGRSKLMVERMLEDIGAAQGLRYTVLRYFNAAGADPLVRAGERHDPETHLIPLVLQTALGQRPMIKVFGRDYATADGTCVRDYVHVADLCDAHALALDALMDGAGSATYNLGNGSGYSVDEVIAAARRVTGRVIPTVDAPRRAGDPARLVADAARARLELGWSPRYGALDTIVADAWHWHLRMAREAGVAARTTAAVAA